MWFNPSNEKIKIIIYKIGLVKNMLLLGYYKQMWMTYNVRETYPALTDINHFLSLSEYINETMPPKVSPIWEYF